MNKEMMNLHNKMMKTMATNETLNKNEEKILKY